MSGRPAEPREAQTGLFCALVIRNADAVRSLLEASPASAAPPLETLRLLGPQLLALLISNLQIRRVIGRQPPLDEAAIAARAERVLERFFKLAQPSVKSLPDSPSE